MKAKVRENKVSNARQSKARHNAWQVNARQAKAKFTTSHAADVTHLSISWLE
jgi:hypothetical protein